MTTNDWLRPGAQAVILQPYDRAALRVETVTIDRVLKRDVVLSNGERFNAQNLDKRIGGTWGTTLYLVSPDDPRVSETRIQIRRRNLRYRATAKFDDWRVDKASAAEVAEAFQALADFEERA